MRGCLLIFVVLITGLTMQAQRSIVGSWYGELNVQGSVLILTADISANEDGTLSGFVNSPMQGASNIPITTLFHHDDSVRIEIASLTVVIRGLLLPGDSVIRCSFEQGPFTLPLDLIRKDSPFAFDRPQEPKKPYPYVEQEVKFRNELAGINLAGTLTLPNTDDIFTAVVLVSGSGPQDRNEELMGHKPFMVIADFLTRHGIAVLRYDDRGIGESEGEFGNATTKDFAEDAEAAVKYLRGLANLNAANIGVIGHSEGGMVAQMVAAHDTALAFIIMLAGPVISGEEILITQIRKIQQVNGQKGIITRIIVKDALKSFSILKNNADNEIAVRKLEEYFGKRAAKFPKKIHTLFGYDSLSVQAKIKAYNSPWFRYFLVFQPEDYLKQINIPVLALFGGKDVQVLYKPNTKALKKIKKKYRKPNIHLKTYSGRNHMFQEAATGTLTEYAVITETFGVEVLEDMVKFIKVR